MAGTLLSLTGSIVGFIFKGAGSVISFLSKYAVTDNGSRHIHGQAPSEGQVMNQEGRDQTCRNQPDLCVIMISLAVASRIISPW